MYKKVLFPKSTPVFLILFLVIFIFFIFPLTIYFGVNDKTAASSLPVNELQSLLDNTVKNTKIPGAVMTVTTPAGEWIGTAGKACNTGQDMTADTQLRIASVTKQFTSVLIMKLIEENRLSLDDTVAKWLPDAEIKSAEKMTVANLLNHTSGVPDHEGNEKFWKKVAENPEAAWSHEKVLSLIKNKKPDFEPGTKWKYSNTGYYLLGLIAEKATDTSVNKLLQNYFFKPIGMKRTAVVPSGKKTEPFAEDYCWFKYSMLDMRYADKMIDTSRWNLSWDWTAGSGVTTANDMLIWSRSLFGGELLDRKTYNLMFSTTVELPVKGKKIAYCYGFSKQKNQYGETVYSKDGENAGVEAKFLYYPESKRSIFVAFNRSDFPTPYKPDNSKTEQYYMASTKIMDNLIKKAVKLLIEN
ncbi:MAG: beta-lactamase family protein [Victivallales bacterium]|nr:beta-lactamase family protein [Victivallales bacterium]